jgi:hypothetical protein
MLSLRMSKKYVSPKIIAEGDTIMYGDSICIHQMEIGAYGEYVKFTREDTNEEDWQYVATPIMRGFYYGFIHKWEDTKLTIRNGKALKWFKVRVPGELKIYVSRMVLFEKYK